jgi:glutathione S-transferase
MLEELEVPYELMRLDPKQGENKTPGYLAINPTGKVPSLVDGEVTMFESAAIVAYLGDKFADKKLAPPVGSNDRAAYYQWLFFGMTTLEQPLSLYTSHTVSLSPEKRVAHVAAEAKEEADRALGALESSLGDRDWLLGRFTGADIIVGGSVLWASSLKLLEGHPTLASYARRIKERPAFRRSRQD